MNKTLEKSIKNISKKFIDIDSYSTDLILEAENLAVAEQIVPPITNNATVSLELPECVGFPVESNTEVFDDDCLPLSLENDNSNFSQEFHELIKTNRRRKSLKRKSPVYVPDLSKRYVFVGFLILNKATHHCRSRIEDSLSEAEETTDSIQEYVDPDQIVPLTENENPTFQDQFNSTMVEHDPTSIEEPQNECEHQTECAQSSHQEEIRNETAQKRRVSQCETTLPFPFTVNLRSSTHRLVRLLFLGTYFYITA